MKRKILPVAVLLVAVPLVCTHVRRSADSPVTPARRHPAAVGGADTESRVPLQNDSDESPSGSADQGASVGRLVAQLGANTASTKDRAKALQDLFRAKDSLSAEEQLEFWRATRQVAGNPKEDARLRAQAIWVIDGVGMMFQHEKTWDSARVSQECHFLLKVAADESEDLQVRRMGIKALGDLKMAEALPILKALLEDKANLNLPEIARSASIALAELAPEQALKPVGQVLSTTENPSVFGSAAYALGRIKSPEAIPLLVENRLRLGDNLSVDNAIEAASGTVLTILRQPSDPHIIPAIQATRSLWREEQKAEYAPLLRRVLADKTLPIDARREALKRLIEDADLLALDARKEQISALVPLVQGEGLFSTELDRMRQILGARILPAKRVEEKRE